MNDLTYYVKTGVGKFRVEKSCSYNLDGSIKYNLLKIGGQRFCIEYTFRNDSDTVELQWIRTEKGISNISIKGTKTLHLFNLSVNLLKHYGNFKYIKFIDNSNFDCILPDNKVTKISLNKYYILFHRKTWYETKLNAIPKYSEDIESYNKIKELFNNPLRKPKYFDFKNDDLTKILTPIFDSSKTWVEFLDNIYKLPDICQKIYPWYIDAIMYIKSPYKLPEEWIIIIDDKIPEIKYERILLGSGTRKSKKLPEYKGELTYYIPDPEEIRNFKYIL
jgi:hypothetical protein